MNYTRTKISCYLGYFVQAIIVSFLPLLFVTLNSDYGVSYMLLGSLSVITFVVQLFVDILSVRFLKYIGYKKGVILAHLCSGVGFIMLCVLPEIISNTYLAVMLSCIVFSVGGGLIEVIVSPIIEYLPTRNKASQMSLLHSFFCWGQVLTVALTTVLFLFFGRDKWQYIALIWAAISFINMFLFIGAPIVEPTEDGEKGGSGSILRSPVFYAVMILMLAAGATEISVSGWASAFTEAALGLNKAVGDILGLCAFALLMGVGRLFYGLKGDRIKIERVMLFCGIMCLICYILLFLNINPWLSVIACAMTGLAVSVMWPGSLSIGAKRFSHGGTLLFGLAAAFGDSGCSIAPFIMGAVASRSSINNGFLVCSIFPVIIIVCSLYFLKYGCKKD